MSLSATWKRTRGRAVQVNRFLIWALDVGEWSNSHNGRLKHGKQIKCPLNSRLGVYQRWPSCFRKEKNPLPVPEFNPWNLQPLASRYIDLTELPRIPVFNPCICLRFFSVINGFLWFSDVGSTNHGIPRKKNAFSGQISKVLNAKSDGVCPSGRAV